MNSKTTLRQQKIINSARQIIITKGMEHLTVREIAKDLKMTDGALYRHFKSKKEILNLLIDDIEQTLLEAIETAARKSAQPLNKLELIFLSHLSYVEQRKGVSFIVINQTLSMKDRFLQKKMFAVVNRYLRTIREVLAEGVLQKIFRNDLDLEASSIMFFGIVQSLVTLWGLSGYRYRLRRKRLEYMFKLYTATILIK